ncbi:MAG: PqiC family protein [Methylophilaceae bacterium]
MNTIIRLLVIFACICVVWSCASVHSTNFYTLSRSLPQLPNNEQNTVAIENAPSLRVSVNVPDGLKRPQIVLNNKDGSRISVLEHDRWLSAFDEELKDALTSGIHNNANTQSLSSNNHYQISVKLLQMDTMLADTVTANFHWKITRNDNVSRTTKPSIPTCEFSASKPISNTVASAVKGMQAIVQDLAQTLSEQIVKMESGPVNTCS